MADLTLQYQRAMPGGISRTGRECAGQLRFWGSVLLVFAGTVGWVMFEKFCVQRVVSGWVPAGPFMERAVYRSVYHWNRAIRVLPFAMPPVVLGVAYWWLARELMRRRERLFPMVALILAMIHTLVGTLLILYFLLLGSFNLQFGRHVNVTTIVTAFGCALAVAMVPGTFYLSIRLMDLVGERRALGEIAGQAGGAVVSGERVVTALGEGVDEDDDEDEGRVGEGAGGHAEA